MQKPAFDGTLRIFRRFCNNLVGFQLTHYPLTNELAVILEDDLKQICWAERERTVMIFDSLFFESLLL